jgi:uncharacterized membrane protein HdeD (DUF308 family)
MERFEQKWWMELIKGIVVLGFGLYCLIKPDQALTVIGIIAGIAMIVMGVVFAINAIRLKSTSAKWWFILIEAAIDIILGVILLVIPREAADTLVRLLGVWIITMGVFRFLRLWIIIDFDRSMAIISGVAGLLIGGVLLLYPGFITMSITVVVGTILALFGVFIILDAMRQKP